MKKWEDINYQTINSATIRGGTLITSFANGDVTEIALQALLPNLPDEIIRNIKADNIHFNSYQIEIEIEAEPKFIPWDKIRVLTDRDFSKYLAKEAEEQAKLIGIKLKRLREKKNIKSNDLADRSGITAQTISRIEKGHQDVGFTTLRKLLASMGYTLTDLANEEIELESELTDKTFSFLLKRLSRVGIEPAFVTNKLIPKNLQAELTHYIKDQPDLLLDEAASYLSNIYGWELDEIWSNTDLAFDETNIGLTLFKKGARSNYNQIKAYLPYARYLANAVLKASADDRKMSFPKNTEEFKQILDREYGGLYLKSIVSYSWDMGICVIPLKDSGIFHGAAWKINSRHVIILKQQVSSHSKWIFDLLHELYHALVHLKDGVDMILESSEISPLNKDEDPREQEANTFASQVIFNGDAEHFAKEVVTIAKGKVEFLKGAISEVAEKNNLRPDSLANYLAHRLSNQGTNWWPTADSFQEKEPEPFTIVRDILLERIQIEKLRSIDYNLLSTALNN